MLHSVMGIVCLKLHHKVGVLEYVSHWSHGNLGGSRRVAEREPQSHSKQTIIVSDLRGLVVVGQLGSFSLDVF